MENFEFKSAICTSRSQSEKLLALGLKKETADMTIHIKKDDSWYVTAEPFYEWEDDMNTLPSLEEPELIIPAWSLHRLLMMYGDNYSFFSLNNAYGELIHAIAIDIEKGTFNKDYLEEKK